VVEGAGGKGGCKGGRVKGDWTRGKDRKIGRSGREKDRAVSVADQRPKMEKPKKKKPSTSTNGAGVLHRPCHVKCVASAQDRTSAR